MCKTKRFIMSIFLCVILMMFFDSSTTTLTTTEFPKEFDFRYTSYQELEQNFNIFQHDDIVGYDVQLTVDNARNQLLVGGRGMLCRLSLDDLRIFEITEWQALNDTKRICRFKGQTEDACYNFIRVLLVYEDQVFTCGTNAFSPKCTWRSADNFTNIVESIEGQAYCPYSPDHNSTFVMTSDGSYFSGTFIDHPGRDPAIYRLLGSQRVLRTVSNSKWLNEPNFVSAYEIDDFVYVFFREVAVEYINCGKRVFSRVARVCKNDQGGDLVLDDNWTTFLKARMNCSIPGEFPFYFDELQSTFLLKSPEETLLYGIFTTPVNSLEGSAVCVFNMTSLNSTFTGPYKYQENARSAWERNENKDPIYQCPETQTDSKNKRELDETEITKRTLITLKAQKYQMMDPAVQPEGISPTLVGKNERWTHIVVDYVEGKTGIYKVIFIATARGHIRKLVQLPGTDKPCLIEEIDLVPNGDHKPVQQLQISREKGALYVSILYKVIQIPLHRCNRFTDSDLCLNAMDPYCGWNLNTEQCTTAPEGMPSLYYWQQDMSSCPQVQHPVDGGWSKWSEWLPCQQTGNDPSAGQCLCHTRICDNPRPLYGGNDCVGSNVEVTNCTAHGQWTEWTQWSSCSFSCGHNGTRTRQRYCSNPPPKFGGRSCVGSNTDEGYCPGNPSCPEPPVNGNWARWSDWGQCTAECNGGIQTRRRQCNNPPPSQEGLPCTGNKQEWRMCNTQICRERQHVTPWSPWVKTNMTEDGYFEQRYRFMCRANVPDDKMIKSSHVKSHVRYCFNRDNECHRPDLAYNITENGNWSDWSQWSVCTVDCGTGIQWRRRSCNNPSPAGFGRACNGHYVEARECNSHSCQGEWSCWTEYSACSVTCGSGTKIRLRRCQSTVPGTKYQIPCAGHEEEEKQCYMVPCNYTRGWDEWSIWSTCGFDGIKYRHRSCQLVSPLPNECQGYGVEYQSCIKDGDEIKVESVRSEPVADERTFSLFHLIVVGSAAFFFGIFCSLGLYICVQGFRSFQKFDLEKERRNHQRKERKRKTGSFASQLSLDFLTVNNKVYDSTTLSKERNTIRRDGSLQNQMRTNLRNNEV